MRAWHLVGLQDPVEPKLRFEAHDRSSLFLPSSIPAGDQEQIIAFYQQVITDRPLPRTEIEWYGGVDLSPSRKLVECLKEKLGSSGLLLVIKVRAKGVDLDDVLADSLAKTFEHTVIASAFRVSRPSLTKLAELTKLVEETTQGLYEALVDRVNLEAEWAIVRPLMSALLNPVDVVEAANSLVDVQLEESAMWRGRDDATVRNRDSASGEDVRQAVYRRALRRLLSARSRAEVVALTAMVARQSPENRRLAIPDEVNDKAVESLEADLLVRNGSLYGWAAWLTQEGWTTTLGDFLKLARPSPDEVNVDYPLSWIAPGEPPADRIPIQERIYDAMRLVSDRKLTRAREEIDVLAAAVEDSDISLEVRGDYWDLRARYLAVEKRWDEAIAAFEQALRLLREGAATPSSLATTMHEYACCLREARRIPQAEEAFRETLRLQEEGGDTAISRGVTMDGLGRVLRDSGHLSDAEAAFREALRLKEEGGAKATNRGVTMSDLGRTLRQSGRLSEAEAAFREASRLKEEGGAAATSRGITMDSLGRVLLDTGRLSDAEVTLRKALLLKEEGAASATSRGITMDALGRVLSAAGRLPEAEVAFREALRLADDGGDTATSRGITMDSLGRVLWAAGRLPDAEVAFREALLLKEEGVASATSRGITMDSLGRVLWDAGRLPDAEVAFREALRLAEEGGDTATSRGLTMDALGRVLQAARRLPEAETTLREALRLQEEGGATSASRGITMDSLGRALRDSGRLPEAELAFREALRLGEEGGDSSESLAITITALIPLVEHAGRKSEADALRARLASLRPAP